MSEQTANVDRTYGGLSMEAILRSLPSMAAYGQNSSLRDVRALLSDTMPAVVLDLIRHLNDLRTEVSELQDELQAVWDQAAADRARFEEGE